MDRQSVETLQTRLPKAAHRPPAASRGRALDRTRTWIALMVALVLAVPTGAFAQTPPDQSTRCLGESDSISVSSTVLPPTALFEIELTFQNKATGRIHVDPGRFALIGEIEELMTPLTADQAKGLIDNPGQSFWSFFWFGSLGYAANQAKQADLKKQVDTRILSVTDIQPGAVHKGSLFFKGPNTKAEQFTLVIEGLTSEGSELASLRLGCEFPKGRSGQGAAAPPSVRTFALVARGRSGPIAMGVSKIVFAKDATSLEVTIENASDVEANIFFAMASATLTDKAGKSYALRVLKSEVGDRVAPHSSIRGKLTFEPMPLPPVTTGATLTMPDIRAGDAVYEVKVDLQI